MTFDPESDVGRRYLSYVENRARVWAEKYLDGCEPDYRGDEVLRRYHFCNVWRELDRYSRWEILRIRGKPLPKQLDVIVIGRLTMVPQTIRRLMRGDTADEIQAYVRGRQATGLPWYNPALQIRCRGGADYVTMFVEHRDAYAARRKDILALVKDASDAQALSSALSGVLPHVGPFRAYELATSLTYSEHLPSLREGQLFHVGPGAADGLRMLTGVPTADKAAFEALRVIVARELGRRRGFRWIPPEYQGSPVTEARKFTLRTLEDSLCEFRKHEALSGATGTAAKRRTYRKMNVED